MSLWIYLPLSLLWVFFYFLCLFDCLSRLVFLSVFLYHCLALFISGSSSVYLFFYLLLADDGILPLLNDDGTPPYIPSAVALASVLIMSLSLTSCHCRHCPPSHLVALLHTFASNDTFLSLIDSGTASQPLVTPFLP